MNRARRTVTLALFGAVSLALALATSSQAFSLWPHSLPSPELYTIRGYLDRAPEGAKILDRIDVTVNGQKRPLLVAWYGTPGETGLDSQLSRNMARTFDIRGTKEQLAELAAAAPGTEIEGTFVAYTDGPPFLLISTLAFPGEAKPAS